MSRHLCRCLMVVLLFAMPVLAEDTPAKDKSVADLIKQLDADSFGDREAASADLSAKGKEAVPALIEAAQSDKPEVVTRSLDVLRKNLTSKDAALQEATKEALKKMAAGDTPAARRAADVLTPKSVPTPPSATPRIAPGGIRVIGGGAGGIRIAGIAGGAGMKRMSVRMADGNKEIEAVEGDRTVKISEAADKSIKITVTDKKDGKEEKKEYAAKNADELKEKQPEGHKIYEQYNKGGGAGIIGDIRIEAFPGAPGGFAPAIPVPLPIPVPAVPVPAAPPKFEVPTDATKAAAAQVDKLIKQLDERIEKLKKSESPANADAIRQAVEAIEQSKKDLKVLQDSLSGK